MYIITTTSSKGGVGKTTLAVFLTQALAKMGYQTLGIDLDHNNNFTDFFLREVATEDIIARNVYDVLTGKLPLPEAIWECQPLLDVIAATPKLSRIGIELAQDLGASLRFTAGLRRLDHYDFIVLDTHNGLNFGMQAALFSSDLVLCPVAPSRWTIQGYQEIEKEVLRVEESLGKKPGLLAVPSMVSPTGADEIRATRVWKSTWTAIMNDPALRNAVNLGRGLKSGSRSEALFTDLAQEVKNFLNITSESA